MYLVGRQKFKSKEYYQRLVWTAFTIFFIMLLILTTLKDNMNFLLYNIVVIIDIGMLVHLFFKYLHSNQEIDYMWHKY